MPPFIGPQGRHGVNDPEALAQALPPLQGLSLPGLTGLPYAGGPRGPQGAPAVETAIDLAWCFWARCLNSQKRDAYSEKDAKAM